MNKRINWIVAGALGVSGMAFMGCERSNTTGTRVDSTTPGNKDTNDGKVINNKDDAARTAGANMPGDQIGTGDLTLIYTALGGTAGDALTKKDFDAVVNRLVKADRDRIGDVKDQKFAELDGRIDQLNKDWKAKYGHDINFDNKDFENWVQVQKAGQNADKTMANAMIPASHGLPALTVPLVKDAVAWKIDLPDDVSGTQLKNNLQTHLTMVGQMKDQWPANELDAKHAVVHHVMMALLNKPADMGGSVKGAVDSLTK